MKEKLPIAEFLTQKIWDLYQTHGVPIEISQDILQEKNLDYDVFLLEELINQHQKLSQSQSGKQFKSGLSLDSPKSRALHTTTHILHQVLRQLLGNSVMQRGSAITEEKARFDFNLDRKLTLEEITEIQTKIQDIIDQKLIMSFIETSEKEAKKMGAIGLFGEKYGEKVTVYSLIDNQGKVFSREFCSGPHVENTRQIGNFQILKQKSLGANIKRIEFTVSNPQS